MTRLFSHFQQSAEPACLGMLLIVLVSVFIIIPVEATADQAPQATTTIQIPNPATDLWREVRERQTPLNGTTQIRGTDTAALINPYGDQWRRFRMEQLLPFGGYALGFVVLAILLFYFIRGRIPIEGGVSGSKLFRYTVYERMIHWFMAIIFLFMAFTGLILLFGRTLLLPWMGPELFSLLASASKEGHNLFGPLFALALVLIFIRFVRRNIYEKGDLTWLLKGGGIVGKGHVPSNFFNMGEKSLFWMLVLIGGVIAGSGLFLVFPVFGQSRMLLELSHVAHGIATLAMIAAVIGHIYIGTIGMEGATEGMTTGYCDLNWAREHHSNWTARCEERGEVLSKDEVDRILGTSRPGGLSADVSREAVK